MEKPKKSIQTVTEINKVTTGDSACCGPSCCGNSNTKKNTDRKENQNGNTQ